MYPFTRRARNSASRSTHRAPLPKGFATRPDCASVVPPFASSRGPFFLWHLRPFARDLRIGSVVGSDALTSAAASRGLPSQRASPASTASTEGNSVEREGWFEVGTASKFVISLHPCFVTSLFHIRRCP